MGDARMSEKDVEGGFDADVIVIGGGPAGATVGAYLGRAGHKVVVLERDIHPREHVGESLVPATNIVTHDLGFWDKLEESHFVKKPGATWTGIRGRVGSGVRRDVRRRSTRASRTPEYTYHVDRAAFDAMYLKHASELGAEVVQGVNVLSVLFEADRAVGVRVRVVGREFDLRSRFVVDAKRSSVSPRQAAGLMGEGRAVPSVRDLLLARG